MLRHVASQIVVRSRTGKNDPPEDDRHASCHRQIEVLAVAEARQRASHGHDDRTGRDERTAQARWREPPDA